MEVKKICSAVGLEDVTKKYLSREKVKEYIEYFDMKCAKIEMEPLEKCRLMRNENCRRSRTEPSRIHLADTDARY